MVSRIEPPQMPPSPLPQRRAEETDTRQAILRHDPDHNRRKKDDDQPEAIDIYEDLADVSIPALRGFLQTLLAKIESAKTASQSTTTSYADHHAHRAPASPKAAAAMAAYQTRAATSSTPPPVISAPVTAAPISTLDAATLNLDRAELLSILRDLDKLESQGVHAISVEKGDGFLASIRAGMAKALSNT